MTHDDHVYLLRNGIPKAGGVWADLGSGTGAFTLALADLIGPAGQIYTVDKDRNALREQERALHANFPSHTVHYLVADFTQRLDLPPLDGVVMANSLHYVRNKPMMLQLVHSYLQPDGRDILRGIFESVKYLLIVRLTLQIPACYTIPSTNKRLIKQPGVPVNPSYSTTKLGYTRSNIYFFRQSWYTIRFVC